MPPPYKMLSLAGHDVIQHPDNAAGAHINDYNYFGNRTDVLAWQGSHWLRPWVSWYDCQQNFWAQYGRLPTGWEETFNYLSGTSPTRDYFAHLDHIIGQANADGVPVILVNDARTPTWSKNANPNGAWVPWTASEANTGKGPEYKFPDNLDAASPWGIWIIYLICRYRAGVAARGDGSGPTSSNIYGNPYGAAVYGLEIINEPNAQKDQGCWPLDGYAGCRVATMMKSARDNAVFHGWNNTGQVLVGPATADKPDDIVINGTRETMSYLNFTNAVLDNVQGWNPAPLYFAWSHHNYRDTTNGNCTYLDTVRSRLIARNWKTVAEGNVWLTEGGRPYDVTGKTAAEITAQENDQNAKVQSMWGQLKQRSWALVWTQHTINDRAGIQLKYGIRRDFQETPTRQQGSAKPLYATWRDLL